MPLLSYARQTAPANDTTSQGRAMAHAQLFGRIISVLTALMMFNTALLFSGMLGDVAELEALFADNSLSDSVVATIGAFLAQPILSLQLLIGLCWLVFHTILPTRAGVVLRKTAFASTEAIQPQPVPSAHGCRAPPFGHSCLFA
ncbi:hypothetical protein [Pseudoalteromonas piscicida]|uniref:Uncharacterized protein n=1 Tax=Pseudoalteromonas piscicida TaxID=43662 RepID=A0A2A5JPE1_PSEO7|nr:hypothetical protein [Pseudoalteromonas piscicida]PCK31288.1 hypothetical protein CEX98_13395 [Pseudoalteromonas piscicida]